MLGRVARALKRRIAIYLQALKANATTPFQLGLVAPAKVAVPSRRKRV